MLAARDMAQERQRLRILVVDDNKDACHTLAALLNLMGHQATCITDPRNAVRAALDTRPQLAFLDLGMPHIDGWTLAEQLRKHFDYEALRLVALTGWGQFDDRRRSGRAGFDAHLVKPAELQLIESILATLTHRR